MEINGESVNFSFKAYIPLEEIKKLSQSKISPLKEMLRLKAEVKKLKIISVKLPTAKPCSECRPKAVVHLLDQMMSLDLTQYLLTFSRSSSKTKM